MLTPGKTYNRLPIIVSPDGEFFTPTAPKNYGEGQAIADVMSGRSRYFFQRLRVEETRFLKRRVWKAEPDIVEFEDRREKGKPSVIHDWQILAGRPFQVPESISPSIAEELLIN